MAIKLTSLFVNQYHLMNDQNRKLKKRDEGEKQRQRTIIAK